ncbi:MAG: kelch repeat-containing protein [Thermoguttaceae bacterium]|jgi:hypothetical protein
MRAINSLMLMAWVTIVAGAAPPQAAKKPKFTAAPAADLSKPVMWASECETPDGRGLRFGGCDQQADDGAAHTQIKVAGQWQPIVEDLRKANPLQKRHGQVRDASTQLNRLLACYRGVYFEGLPPGEQRAAVAGAIKRARLSGLPPIPPWHEKLLAEAGSHWYDPDVKARVDRSEQIGTTALVAVMGQLDKGPGATTPPLLRAISRYVVALQQAAEILDAEPAPRALSPIVYDAKSKLFVLFGGDHLDYMTNDTWVFDPARKRWEQRHPKTAPPPRANHTLTAAGDGKVKLSGGFTHNNVDIWYMGPLYQLRDDGDWTYDVAADAWTSDAGVEGVEPDQRAYRSGAFLPDYFMQGDRPDAAANEAKLKALPVNTWVAMHPPQKPRVNRDWGSACIAPDLDVLLRWSGGHCAHGGSDVPMYHFATNRWELPFPVEFPLGQCYSNTSYPTGFNFNRRPWVSGHTYKSFGYDPAGKLMVFTGHNPWSYLFDPRAGDWVGRSKKPAPMCYDSSFYTLTLCSTGKDLYCWGGQYGRAIGMYKWQPGTKTWETLHLTGVKLPGPECDHSGLAFDAKRNRLILFPRKYAGRLYALDCRTNELAELRPGGANAAAATIGFWRELAYVPDADAVLVVGASLAPAGGAKDPPRPSLAYDCDKNAWIALDLGGTHPAGKGGRDVSLGSAYDAKRRLAWATDTNGEVYVLRLDMKAARKTN